MKLSNFKFRNNDFEVIELNQKITVKRLNDIVNKLIKENLYIGIDKDFEYLLVTNKREADKIFGLME